MEMEKEVLILNLDDVLPNRFQPRIKFNEKNILELADSIREHGVIQPIVVRKIADKYEIIAGERRYKASVLAGKTTIPAIVTNLDDKNSAEIALIENVQRQDLTPIEEAISYKKILDMGYINQAALAEKLGKTQSTIANKLRLLNLDDEVQEALLEEKISERHARSLLKLNKNDQVQMLNRIMNERMTVRKTDEEINKLLNNSNNTEVTEETTDPNGGVDMNPMNDIEIIDIDENKILNAQNNNTQNNVVGDNFHIPLQPIIEDQPVQMNLINDSTVNNNTINPGFMDIDKIATQAQDIFVKREEPQVVEKVPNESEVVEPKVDFSVNPIEPQVEVVEEPDSDGGNAESKPTVGRFFNMINMNREENSNYVSDLEEKEVNMDFNQSVMTSPKIVGLEQNSILEPMEQLVPDMNQSKVQSVIEEPPTNFIFQPNFGDVNQSSQQNEPPTIEPVTDTFQPVNTYTLNDDAEFSGPVNSPVEMAVPREQQFVGTINNNEIQPVIIDSSKQQVESVVDFKTVINTIRDCVKTIEGYGYIVDEEEIDLENRYQVSIIIDKQ